MSSVHSLTTRRGPQSRHSSSEGTAAEEQNTHEQQHDEGQNGDTEKGDKDDKSQQPPQPVGFWDPSLNKVRKSVLIGWVRTTLIIMAFILIVLSLYWAVLFKVEENLEALKIAVVDFDGQLAPYMEVEPLVGPMITKLAQEQADTSSSHLGYVVHPPSKFNNDPIAVRQFVYDEHAWAAIIINSNATALLESAVYLGNTSYDPLGACQLIYNEARDQTTYSNYITPNLDIFEILATSSFGEVWAKRVLQNTTLSRSTMASVPQAISPAIGFSTFNLRPFTPPTATPAVTIGLIYLIIIAFFSFAFYLPIHTQFLIPKGHPPLHFWQMIIWRYLATITAYLFLSLSYSLVSLAFQIPFSRPSASDTIVASPANAYHHASFFVYWMLNFIGMVALGLASENVTMFIGQPWTAFWLIFWVISNVCTSFYEISIEPRFFYWGYAWPLHNIVEASRTIIFDTHSKIGLNFGILFAWSAVNTVVFPVACCFMRWNTLKGEGKKPAGLKGVLR